MVDCSGQQTAWVDHLKQGRHQDHHDHHDYHDEGEQINLTDNGLQTDLRQTVTLGQCQMSLLFVCLCELH